MNGTLGLKSLFAREASATHTRVGGVLLVVLCGAALQVVTQTLLARTLTKSEVGLVSLLLGALPVLSTLSLIGQDSSIVRFLARVEPGSYDAASHLRRVFALVLPLGAIAALIGAGYYGLGWALAMALVILVVSQNAVTVVTSLLRAAHRYELAMTGTRLPVILVALTLIALKAVDAMTLTSSVVAACAAFGASALFLSSRSSSESSRGAEPVPRSVVTEGLFFFGLSISFAAMIAVDKMIIGKMMTYAHLAIYASVFAIMRGFDFLFYSINYVLMPRVNVIERLSLRKLNLSVGALAALVALAYLLFGDNIVDLLYAGRYNEGANLVLPFVLSGIVKLFYSVPSSIIGGRLPRAALRQFMWYNLVGMAANIVLDIAFIRAMGLVGAAVATAIAWTLRLAGGYVILLLYRGHLNRRAEE